MATLAHDTRNEHGKQALSCIPLIVNRIRAAAMQPPENLKRVNAAEKLESRSHGRPVRRIYRPIQAQCSKQAEFTIERQNGPQDAKAAAIRARYEEMTDRTRSHDRKAAAAPFHLLKARKQSGKATNTPA